MKYAKIVSDVIVSLRAAPDAHCTVEVPDNVRAGYVLVDGEWRENETDRIARLTAEAEARIEAITGDETLKIRQLAAGLARIYVHLRPGMNVADQAALDALFAKQQQAQAVLTRRDELIADAGLTETWPG